MPSALAARVTDAPAAINGLAASIPAPATNEVAAEAMIDDHGPRCSTGFGSDV